MNRLAGALALGCALMSASLSHAALAPAEGGEIWWEACGSGPKTLLLMHDGILHSAAYDGVWPELCRRYRVIRYDRRGYGRTPEARTEYSGADDALAVLKAAGARRAAVLGASNGAASAVSFALTYPEAVEKLLLVGPDFALPPSAFGEALDKARTGAFARKGAAAIGEDPYAVLSPEGRRTASELLASNLQNITHKERRRRVAPIRPRLDQIRAPVLVMVGSGDSPDIQAETGALQALVPGSERVVIAGAGHFVYLDRPEAFVTAIDRFLK